jgi:mannose-1-phosphate guanylyltransferase
MENTYAVIMAGGVGSRFWPASRAKRPKQLLDLTDSGIPMVVGTVQRLLPEIPYERIIIITGKVTEEAVAEVLPEVPRENILAEPEGHNTAPCVGWAALHVRRMDPNSVMAVMPSDHLVLDPEGFLRKLKLAVKAARDGSLVMFGVRPRGPETGFGYVEMAGEVMPGVRKVVRFVEKPDFRTAETYVASWNFTWNSGMFFFHVDRILDEIHRQMPELGDGLDEIDAALDKNEMETVNRVYPTLPSQSIDYGIMEHAEKMLCVPVQFGWFDMGSWDAAYNLAKKDERCNACRAETIAFESKGCLVQADDRNKLVALVGVKNLVVVDTGDALLICNRKKTQNVKEIVNTLKERNRTDLL